MKKYILTLIIVLCACVSCEAYQFPVMHAYQQAYAMNFEIYRPMNLPAGWYVTFDGFPVAQVAENRWVYGQLNYDGAIRPTNVLVGSVIPSSVPGLVRVASVPFYGGFLHWPEYSRIRNSRVNRMGWLYDEGINTIAAWHTSSPAMWIWLGNRWIKLEPHNGEYVWQMLMRWRGFIIDELRKYNVYFYDEPLEAADLARQWGYIWTGRLILRKLRNYRDSGGGNGGNVTSLRDNSGGNGGNNNTPDNNNNNNNGNRGQWDVD
ncbi:MAG: hypothetical protein IJQ56_07215 [Synergistaceae bacterium]|nr:hypothetical protein [Synergistaceae bacterium]